MAADLSFIAHAAQGDADEFATHGVCNGAPERGLANAGWADKAQDHALAQAADLVGGRGFQLAGALLAQLAHRQVFQDAVFDIPQAKMVLVQHLAGVADIQVVGGGYRPGQGDQPIQVGANHTVFGGGSGQAREAVQLAAGLLAGLFGHVGGFDLLAQLFHLDGLFVAFAQLALDSFELLAQEVLALHFFDLRAGLVLDLLANLEHFDLAGENVDELMQLFFGRIDLEQLLGVRQIHALEVGNGVDGLQRIFDGLDGSDQLARDGGDHIGDVAELVAGVAGQGFDLHAVFDGLRVKVNVGLQVRLKLGEFTHPEAGHALNQQTDGAIGGAEQAVDHGDDAQRVEIFGFGDLQLGVARGDQANQAVLAGDNIVHQADGARLPNGERYGGVGVNHQAAQRQDGQDCRQLGYSGVCFKRFEG